MGKIVIIGAMSEETLEIKKVMKDVKESKVHDLLVYEGSINGRDCVLCQSGVGKVNAARTTQLMIDRFDVEYVINVGSAGAVNDELNIGDVVIGSVLVQHDFDTTAFGDKKGYISNVGDNVRCDSALLDKAELVMREVMLDEEKCDVVLNSMENTELLEPFVGDVNKIVMGVIASGDIFCTDLSMKKEIRKEFGAECVEMEGAAIAQVCMLERVPVIVIRSVSDTPDGNNSITFEQFLSVAAKRCAHFICKFID